MKPSKTQLNVISLLLVIFLLLGTIPIQVQGQTMEWKVEVGDKKSYTYTKFSREGESEYTKDVTTSSGKANVTLKKGLTITIEITRLAATTAYGKTTYNGDVTEVESAVTEVMPVYGNREDWETFVAASGGMYELEGDLLTMSISANNVMKWNINTGWLTYMYLKVGDTETEMTEGTGGGGSASVFMLPVLTALCLITIVIRRKQ